MNTTSIKAFAAALCLLSPSVVAVPKVPIVSKVAREVVRQDVLTETVHEVIASLSASSIQQPSIATITKAGLTAVQKGASCMAMDESGLARGELRVTCGLLEERLLWPPTKAAEAAAVLVRVMGMVDRKPGARQPAPLTSARVDQLCRDLAGSLNDPWTAYLATARPGAVEAGPGFELWPRDPSLIRTIHRGTSAHTAGLLPGFRIMQIDNEATAQQSYQEIAYSLLGAQGSEVRLRIQRPDGGQEDIKLRRNQSFQSAESHQMLDDTLVLRVPVFKSGTASNVLRVLQSNNPARIILDLRQNPGGLVPEAVATLDMFLRDGQLAGVRAGPKRPTEDYMAHAEVHDTPVPLAVLIDGSSASASELVALSLQQRRRALVLGEASAGKGTVQRQIKLPNGATLKVTAAYYVGPLGTPLDERGIHPDVSLAQPTTGTTMLEGGAALEDSWVLAALDAMQSTTNAAVQKGAGPAN
jgi:C-terminal peptidase prc